MKRVYQGLIDTDKCGCLTCGNCTLISQINDDFQAGQRVLVQYFIADKPITENEAIESLVLKSIGGDIDSLDFVLECYSCWTILDYNEELVIDGHDLFQELSDSDGKYLLLIIEEV